MPDIFPHWNGFNLEGGRKREAQDCGRNTAALSLPKIPFRKLGLQAPVFITEM
jgi:hypothetical protein